MKNVVQINDDRMQDSAIRWILKLDEGELSATDKDALHAWLSDHPRNKDVLLEVAMVWDKTETLACLADIFPHSASGKTSDTQPQRSIWRAMPAIAASLFFLMSAGVLWTLMLQFGSDEFSHQMQMAEYQTVVGDRKTVLLPDGSEMILNTDSRVNLAFNDKARVVYLQQGEIHIRVAKDSRPLSVVANDQIVQAKGTEFTVEITEEQHVEVMVTEGRVVVGLSPKSALFSDDVKIGTHTFIPPPVLLSSADNTITAGEELLLAETESVRSVVSSEEIEVKLSWKEGSLVFRSQPLEEVLQQVERYTRVEFVVMDEHLKTIALTGRFQTGDVETLLDLLEVNFNIRHVFEGEGRVLLSVLN